MFHRGNTLLNRIYTSKCVFRCKSLNPKSDVTSDGIAVKKYLGQPTHGSHPHLIGKDEVLPLVTAKELRQRREKLVRIMCKSGQDKKNHVIVIPSATKQYMSDKIPYVFRQNSDFLYFTGCQEPDTCLVIVSTPSGHTSTLFVRNPDSHSELWDGPRTSPRDAQQFFGVDQALPMNEFAGYTTAQMKPTQPTFLWYDLSNPLQANIEKVMQTHLNDALSKAWDSPKQYMHRVRLIKSPAEVELMRRTCEMASKAIINCMKISKSGISEHELFAQVDYDCRMLGANFLAYPPVIAGGDRATTIHYINNNQVVNDGEMVLMDAGCEYFGYSSDITRTWPVNGSFTEAQKELYDAVLSVQQDLIQLLSKRPSLDQLLTAMYLLLAKRLQEIGLIKKSDSQNEAIKSAYRFCPHHVSHYLGMDVHDTPTVSRNIPLQPGMVITVEPGVYINNEAPVPKEFRGLGVRIEDDVLITEGEPTVLTSMCPKSVGDIENISSYINNRL